MSRGDLEVFSIGCQRKTVGVMDSKKKTRQLNSGLSGATGCVLLDVFLASFLLFFFLH